MKKAVLFILSAIILTSCSSSLKTTSQYDETKDFSAYKTFSFMGWTSDVRTMSKEDKTLIEQSVKKELEARGMTYSKFNGDVILSLFLIIDESSHQTAYRNHYMPYSGYSYSVPWAWSYGYEATQYRQHNYRSGTLVIDMFDESTKSLTWQGVIQSKINEKPEARQYSIPRVIAAAFKKYPVKAE